MSIYKRIWTRGNIVEAEKPTESYITIYDSGGYIGELFENGSEASWKCWEILNRHKEGETIIETVKAMSEDWVPFNIISKEKYRVQDSKQGLSILSPHSQWSIQTIIQEEEQPLKPQGQPQGPQGQPLRPQGQPQGQPQQQKRQQQQQLPRQQQRPPQQQPLPQQQQRPQGQQTQRPPQQQQQHQRPQQQPQRPQGQPQQQPHGSQPQMPKAVRPQQHSSPQKNKKAILAN